VAEDRWLQLWITDHVVGMSQRKVGHEIYASQAWAQEKQCDVVCYRTLLPFDSVISHGPQVDWLHGQVEVVEDILHLQDLEISFRGKGCSKRLLFVDIPGPCYFTMPENYPAALS
jgi:hypothetical protein